MSLTDGQIIDPSTLTTQQIQREVGALKELVEQRFFAIEKAVSVAHENLVRVPTDTDKAIGHLKEILLGKLETVNERFSSIQTQFHERDVRVEQTARDTKVAIDAALAAQEKSANKQADAFSASIGKSEAATAKQIDQQSQQFNSVTGSMMTMINDLKERMTRAEGTTSGQREAKTTQQTSNMNAVSIIGLVIGSLMGLGGLIVTLYFK